MCNVHDNIIINYPRIVRLFCKNCFYPRPTLPPTTKKTRPPKTTVITKPGDTTKSKKPKKTKTTKKASLLEENENWEENQNENDDLLSGKEHKFKSKVHSFASNVDEDKKTTKKPKKVKTTAASSGDGTKKSSGSDTKTTAGSSASSVTGGISANITTQITTIGPTETTIITKEEKKNMLSNKKVLLLRKKNMRYLPIKLQHEFPLLEILIVWASGLKDISYEFQVQINDLDGKGYGFENLKQINLRNNAIAFIYKTAFIDLKKLEILDLSENLISSLDPNHFMPLAFSLKSLSMSSNRLIELQEDLFQVGSKIEYLNVNNNEIECVKIDFTKFKFKKVLGFENVCADFYLNGKDMKAEDLNELLAENCSKKIGEIDFDLQIEEEDLH